MLQGVDLAHKRVQSATIVVAITIKSLPAEVHERLKLLAAQNHRSLQKEILFCLERYANRSVATREERLAKVAKLHAELPGVDHRLIDDMKRDGRA